MKKKVMYLATTILVGGGSYYMGYRKGSEDIKTLRALNEQLRDSLRKSTEALVEARESLREYSAYLKEQIHDEMSKLKDTRIESGQDISVIDEIISKETLDEKDLDRLYAALEKEHHE